MALQSSGAIALDDMHVEAGGTTGSNCTVNDSDIRGLIDASDGATTSFDDWYGASSFDATSGHAYFFGSSTKVGASPAFPTSIDTVDIGTDGNATDFGDYNTPIGYAAALGSATRGCIAGGSTGSGQSTQVINDIRYITFAATGSTSDFGDLAAVEFQFFSTGNATRGLFAGGVKNGITNTIQYITIANTGNTSDFGDLTVARHTAAMGQVNSTTRGLFLGGTSSGGYGNVIDYVTIGSTGNASDFGNLLSANVGSAGCCSATRGVISGGTPDGGELLNVIQYVTISSTGNALDFGDLSSTWYVGSGASNKVKGIFAGSRGGSSTDVTIDKITIGSTGNASDFGDLSRGTRDGANCGNLHGGIG